MIETLSFSRGAGFFLVSTTSFPSNTMTPNTHQDLQLFGEQVQKLLHKLPFGSDTSKCPKRHPVRQMTQNLTKLGAEVVKGAKTSQASNP